MSYGGLCSQFCETELIGCASDSTGEFELGRADIKF